MAGPNIKYRDFLNEQNTGKKPCPFDNPLPEHKILENDLAYMTLALAPYHEDHMLIIPKRHVAHIFDVTHEEHAAIRMLERAGWDILKHLGHNGVSIIVREGKTSGGTVEHLHYHLIPDTRLGDMDHNGDERLILSPEQFAAGMRRIRDAL
jgi:diadenosine tetraphosphate (Ap4A) HIT family hydrolase